MAASEVFSLLLELVLDHYLLSSSTVLLLYYVLNRETRNVPPGPTGLPILGYIPFLKNLTAHEQLWKLSRKYGSVFSIKLGLNDCIIVNDHKSAIELLANEATHARPLGNLFTLFMRGDNHLINWHGPLWKEHRRFVLKSLRTVGVGKPEMEQLITGEISYMLDQIDKDSQGGTSAVNVDKYLTPSTSNVVHAVLTGKRFDYDHPVRVKQDSVFGNQQPFPMCWTGYVAHFIPVFNYIFSCLQRIPNELNQRLKDGQEVLKTYLQQETKAQLETPSSAPDANIMAAYIAEMKLKKSNGEETYLDADRLPGLAASLLGAGSGTVRGALEWAYLYCAYCPDIQDRLIMELETVIGYDRKPLYADRQNMPYTQAFIWQTMRHSITIPINIPHLAMTDIPINGYTIPKGYHIYVNAWAIHNDPNYWDKPEEFTVERFLTPEGDKLVKHEALMPFSMGRRSCPGEPLAQVELFTYLVLTLQKFKIQAPVGVKLNLEGVVNAFAICPKHLFLTFTNRK